MADQKKAYAFGLGAVLCWSTVATAFKLSLRFLDPVQLLLYSGISSLLVLGLILLVRGDFHLIFSFSRKQYLQSLVLGLVNPLFYYLVLFKAYDLLPAQEAQPINYTWAVTLALLSIPLLKQRITALEMLAVLVSYSGVVVISTHGDVLGFRFSNLKGVGLALFSTLIWALFWIFSTKDKRDPIAGLFLNFLFSLPFTLMYCLVFSTPLVTATSWKGLAGAAYVGVFEMGAAFALWLSALKYSVNTARVGNLIFLSPFLSLVFIHFFLGEDILPSTYAGLGLIMGGLFIQRLAKSKA